MWSTKSLPYVGGVVYHFSDRRNILKKIFFIISILFATLFISCNGGCELEGKWKTVQIVNHTGYITKCNNDSFLEIWNSDENIQLSGNAGVNVFNGYGEFKDGKVINLNLGITKMMGDPTDQKFEDEFIQILSSADAYKIVDDILIIKSSKKEAEVEFIFMKSED